MENMETMIYIYGMEVGNVVGKGEIAGYAKLHHFLHYLPWSSSDVSILFFYQGKD